MKIIEVQRFRRIIPNSCAACGTQVIAYFFGYLLKPQEAFDLVNAKDDGAAWWYCLTQLNKKFGIRRKWLGTIKKIENWIDKGLPVASGDDGALGPHAVVIVGYDQDNFYVADSNRADLRVINKDKLFNYSDEFYGVFK